MKQLSKNEILRSWLPLASTWIMMAVEGPYIAAIVARMDAPDFNLAAFGVTFAIGLLMEAPVIMMMAAAARLISGRHNYLKLRKFNIILSISCTVAMLGMLIPSIFNFWTADLLGLDPEVQKRVYPAMVCMLMWPGMIGYRRFYQGILISAKSNKRVAIGTILRLVAMSATAFIGFKVNKLDGASIGTLSLSVGVTAEAIFVRLMARYRVRQLLVKNSESSPLSMKQIIHFYYPLALTAMIGLTVQPLVTFAMGKALFPLESLAVLPVVNSLVFFFRAIPLSFQEVVITLMGQKEENYTVLKSFAIWMGVSLTTLLGLLAFTDLSDIWFTKVSGLRPELSDFAQIPLMLAFLTPATSLLLCWPRSLLIVRKNTGPVTNASLIELVVIAAVLLVGITFLSYSGAIIALGSLTFGRIASTSYLRFLHKV